MTKDNTPMIIWRIWSDLWQMTQLKMPPTHGAVGSVARGPRDVDRQFLADPVLIRYSGRVLYEPQKLGVSCDVNRHQAVGRRPFEVVRKCGHQAVGSGRVGGEGRSGGIQSHGCC
jgi:hypothetical protein